MTQNLLAIIRPDDMSHSLIESFFKSLPPKFRRIDAPNSYIGGFDKNFECQEEDDKRKMIIFRADSFDCIDDEYFAKHPGTAILEIPDRLFVRTRYSHFTPFFGSQVTMTFTKEGSIDSMIRLYKKLKIEPLMILITDFMDNPELKSAFTRRKLSGRRELKRTYLSIGLETPDEKYLLGMFGSGPYIGRVPSLENFV